MRFSAAILLGAAGLAAAQSSATSAAAAPTASGSASGCGSAIDQIIAACLDSTTPRVKACSANDWNCMCKAQQAVVTCYDNCPSAPDAFGAQQQETSWCNAAKAYGDSSSAAAPTGTGKTTMMTSSTATTTGNSGPQTGFASASGSAAPSSTGAGAASSLTPAGGLFAAVLGLALL